MPIFAPKIPVVFHNDTEESVDVLDWPSPAVRRISTKRLHQPYGILDGIWIITLTRAAEVHSWPFRLHILCASPSSFLLISPMIWAKDCCRRGSAVRVRSLVTRP
ncbi:hypothetical protein PILCRDRAFT_196583 [Piloderma croceum F 1598]|uniref:Uncharacterized protein n=1 Tax=Piloderma croceum (strain F 1598) TaxID=765440 RepID=A0A0C3BTC2_PILCF|nr:hypothetical protein PILCRDRAFT_196583 [Piloderma croceum F 1598]